jgi:hypothetical protein
MSKLMINLKILSLGTIIASLFIINSCGIFDRVTAEVPLEFDIPIEFDIDSVLKLAHLDTLPDELPPGIVIEDLVVPLPARLSTSISDREEIKQYAQKIYNIRIESLAFIIEENGFTQEVRPSVLGIAKKFDGTAVTAVEQETILVSTLPGLTPDIETPTTMVCGSSIETPETTTTFVINKDGEYNCEPVFDSEAAVECNMIPGGKDAPSEHLKKLEFTPKIMYCDPKTKTLKEGLLLYINSDKHRERPKGNIKLKIHMKIVLRVAPLG